MLKFLKSIDLESHPVLRALAILIATVSRVMSRDVMLFAGGASYFGMLALFPAMALGMSVYGLVYSIDDAEAQIMRFAGIMPERAQDFVLDQMARLAAASTPTLSVNGAIALGIALFAASRGAKAVIAGLNYLAGEQDIRNVIHFNILAMGSVIIGGGLLVTANLAVLAIPVVLRQIFAALSLPQPDFGVLLNEWTAAAIVMFVALELLYRMTMRRRAEAVGWRASSLGALVSTLLWLGLSKGFSVNVGGVIDFGVYGSLGALVVFLLWIYWSAYAVFFGGALALEIDARTGPVTPGLPPGAQSG